MRTRAIVAGGRLVLMPPASLLVALVAVVPGRQNDPDALYAARDSLPQARLAETIWADRLVKDPDDFESAWKLARVRYWLGGHTPDAEGKVVLERGIEAARAAILIEPARPEGYFWLAAAMGALAERSSGPRALSYRGPVKQALLTVLRVDRAWQQGSADRALGRWYYKVPGLFGGSKSRSEEHLRRSLAYAPASTASLFFLAETLLARDRDAEAREALEAVLAAPLDPEWAPEDREFQALARDLLQRLEADGRRTIGTLP